jgi:hypothetical protein
VIVDAGLVLLFKNAWVGEVTLLVEWLRLQKWEAAGAPKNGDPRMRRLGAFRSFLQTRLCIDPRLQYLFFGAGRVPCQISLSMQCRLSRL